MAELAFLDTARALLVGAPLAPPVTPDHVGVLEPVAAADLPALVLSLESTARVRVGIGERSEAMTGALPVHASIDLANPTLPGDPTFSLVDAARRTVTLPHGGLVRADGTEPAGPLAPADVQVRLGAAPVPVVPGVPDAGQVQADPIAGQLRFGTALPPAGALDVDYFLGQWERRVERVTGVLRLDACAVSGADTEALGDAAVTRLLSPEATAPATGARVLSLTALSSVAHHAAPPAPAVGVAHFRRRATFAFEFQRLVDRAESSGGIIRRIPVVTRLVAERTDRRTGAVFSELVVEPAPP